MCLCGTARVTPVEDALGGTWHQFIDQHCPCQSGAVMAGGILIADGWKQEAVMVLWPLISDQTLAGAELYPSLPDI